MGEVNRKRIREMKMRVCYFVGRGRGARGQLYKMSGVVFDEGAYGTAVMKLR